MSYTTVITGLLPGVSYGVVRPDDSAMDEIEDACGLPTIR